MFTFTLRLCIEILMFCLYTVVYFMLIMCARQCPYSQDCILNWIYGKQKITIARDYQSVGVIIRTSTEIGFKREP